MEERWTAFVDGRVAERIVEVVSVAAFLDPACSCGRLCMGRYRFWYERGGSLSIVDVDRIRLDWAIEEVLEAAPADGYAALPRLVRDWNEDRGWCGADEHFGAAVAVADIAAFADVLGPHIDDAFTAALHGLVRDAVALRAPMKAMTD